MKTIAVVTVGRSDFGILLPVLRAIDRDPDLRLHLIVAGAHLAPQFGMTIREIVEQGLEIGDRVEMSLASDSPLAVATSMALGIVGMSQIYARVAPDVLLVIGDRYEMHAAAAAAVPFPMAIAHIHGGETTRGAIDEALRHAITKYSHLHFVSTEEHRRRVVQLGEAPWRVEVSGAPALDNLATLRLMSRSELESVIGLSLEVAPLLVTFHPVTLQPAQTHQQIDELLAALQTTLEEHQRPIVITKPNADASNSIIMQSIESFARRHREVRVVENLGTRAYFSAMQHAAAMIGNSSSGIIEAASFELPVVNIGIRQEGRPTSGNVIDVDADRTAIASGVRRALSDDFRRQMAGMPNIYGSGKAAQVIVDRLKRQPIDEQLLIKRFHDLPAQEFPASLACDAA